MTKNSLVILRDMKLSAEITELVGYLESLAFSAVF